MTSRRNFLAMLAALPFAWIARVHRAEYEQGYFHPWNDAVNIVEDPTGNRRGNVLRIQYLAEP